MKVFVPFSDELVEALGSSLGELIPFDLDYAHGDRAVLSTDEPRWSSDRGVAPDAQQNGGARRHPE